MNKLKEFWYRLKMLAKRNPILMIFLVFLIIRVLSTGTGNILNWLYTKILILPGIIIGLTFHEAAHAYVSYWLGDPTPRNDGRLSLNPKDHIDPTGFFFLIIAGFGWGQPVRIDSRYYKHMRRGEFMVAFAGVVANFIIAGIFAMIARLLINTMSAEFYNGVGGVILDVVIYVVAINTMLMIFNLIPCPPLDGWGIVTQIFHLEKYEWWYKIYRYGSLILMMMIVFNITDIIITPIYTAIMNFLIFS